jgi:hypothetical protein
MPKGKRPVDPRQQNQNCTLDFSKAYTVWKFMEAIEGPSETPEIFCFGTRGDWKTTGALTGMIRHAMKHKSLGYPIPVPWMGVTDTFQSHKMKTLRSLESPIWKGGWRLKDGGHVAEYVLNGNILVHLDLFGIEDQGAMDRMRMETVGMWFEEPAPANIMVQSSGISLDSWLIGRTSQRIPSHFHPAVATLNYPDEDHWTWDRAVTRRLPGTCYFRIPPGENAKAEDRAEWARALADRPDLLRRLILGEPGMLQLGDQVAKGFSLDDHVAKENLPIIRGEPLFMGFDFWHTPTCVIGQEYMGTIRVLAGLYMEGSAMKQLMEEMVLPWLGKYAPWTLKDPDSYCLIGYDPTGDTADQSDIDNSALQTVKDELGGGWYEEGPVRWENRKEALTRVLLRRNGLLISNNPYTEDLRRALSGRWYYAKSHQGELRSDKPKKPNHPWEDLGDALIYLLCRIGVVSLYDETKREGGKVITNSEYA